MAVDLGKETDGIGQKINVDQFVHIGSVTGFGGTRDLFPESRNIGLLIAASGWDCFVPDFSPCF